MSTHASAVPESKAHSEIVNTGLKLKATFTYVESNIAETFLTKGGKMSSAAATVCRQVAVSGNTTSQVFVNGDQIELEIPRQYVMWGDEGSVSIDDQVQLLLSCSRICVSATGTPVTKIAGEAAFPMKNIFIGAQQGLPVSVPLVYGDYGEHVATVTVSSLLFNSPLTISTVQDLEGVKEAFLASKALTKHWQHGWALRSSCIVYNDLPTLTVPLCRVAAGIRDISTDKDKTQIFSKSSRSIPTCSLLTKETGYPLSVLESMLQAALKVELECQHADEGEGGLTQYQKFFKINETPTVESCKESSAAAAAALRNIGNWFRTYKADGRSACSGNGDATFVVSEHWRDSHDIDICTGGDCDDSATLQVAVAKQLGIGNFDTEYAPDLSGYPACTAVKNALFFHVIGVCILGATAAQGDEVDTTNTHANAGHAIAMAIDAKRFLTACNAGDTMDFVSGRDRSVEAGDLLKDLRPLARTADEAKHLFKLRTNALFPSRRLSALEHCPLFAELKAEYGNDAAGIDALIGSDSMNRLNVLPMEGTTLIPTETMYIKDDARRRLAHLTEVKRETASKKLGPSVGRRLQDLANVRKDGVHSFYSAFVEFMTHGLTYEDEQLQHAHAATGHHVFCRASTPFANSEQPAVAGISPKDAVTANFAMVPLARLTKDETKALLSECRRAEAHRMPPLGPRKVTEWEEANLNRGLTLLKELDKEMIKRVDAQGEIDGVDIEMHITPSVLLRAPDSVSHFVDQVMLHAKNAVVEMYEMPGAMLCATEAGHEPCVVAVVNVTL